MKKLALINLIVLTAIKSVSACSISIDPNNPDAASAKIAENVFYIKIYFYSLVFLIFANFVLFFLRRQKDYLVLVILILTVLIMIPLAFFGMVIQDCGFALGSILKWEFIIFLMVFGLHLSLWVNKTGLHLLGEGLTITKLK